MGRNVKQNKEYLAQQKRSGTGRFQCSYTCQEREEECLGPQVWGKGIAFLRGKEGLLPENMNRSILIDLFKEHDMRCMNTYFQKLNNNKATYRHMWATGMQGPWDTDRYSELDLCLVFGRWSNSIKNVESDSLTSVNTDHLSLK